MNKQQKISFVVLVAIILILNSCSVDTPEDEFAALIAIIFLFPFVLVILHVLLMLILNLVFKVMPRAEISETPAKSRMNDIFAFISISIPLGMSLYCQFDPWYKFLDEDHGVGIIGQILTIMLLLIATVFGYYYLFKYTNTRVTRKKILKAIVHIAIMIMWLILGVILLPVLF
ncbi:MAG TPA: hypothetical protein VM658_22125 [bacterium]|nr:hypothetical protein [bacterium]